MSGFVVAILLCSSAVLAQQNKKVDVEVYYESLCPDSRAFVTNQLYPLWTSPLGKHINITFVPFGKASYVKTDEGYNFTCHHGALECYGNKVQACAIKDIPEENMLMKFINCVMANATNDPKAEYPGAMCAQDLKVPYDMIEACANGTKGDELLVAMGEMTNKLQPKLTSVPTVVLDHKESNSNAVKDLKAEVCSMLSDLKLEECPNKKNSAPSLAATGFLVLTFYSTLSLL